MDRGERSIKHRDGWFSPKDISVERHVVTLGGIALNGLGHTPMYQTLSNSEYLVCNHGSQAASDKIRRREGNNPD